MFCKMVIILLRNQTMTIKYRYEAQTQAYFLDK